MKNILSVLFLAIFCQFSVAQNVAIGTGTPTPDASAVLDLQSTDKGLLVPRVANPASIGSPATGLMVYNTTTNKFNYYNGATWIEIGNGSGTVTSVSGTAPIVSSGGNTPAISISAATPSAAGSMSAADKTKLDASTSANTASAIVARDASGNFIAGTITASLSGNATTASSLAGGSAGRVPYQSEAGTTVFTATSPAAAGLFMRSTAANTWDAGSIQTSDLPATISGAWTRTSPNVTLVNSSDNVGIGSANPYARLNLGADFAGSAHSSILRTNAGALSNTLNSEVVLASIGFLASNTTALGIRARRIVATDGWNYTAIGLGVDVDNTRRPGGEGIWIRSDNANVGIGVISAPQNLSVLGTISVGDAASVGDRLRFSADGVSANINYTNNGPIITSVFGSERMRLTDLGILSFNNNNTNTYPPYNGGGGGAISWNFTGGNGEVDIWNNASAGAPRGFSFRQMTAAGAQTELMRVEGTGGIFGKFRHVTYHNFFNSNYNTGASRQWIPIPGGEGPDDGQNNAVPVITARQQVWSVPYGGRLVKVIIRATNGGNPGDEVRTRVALAVNGSIVSTSTTAVNLNDNQVGTIFMPSSAVFASSDWISVALDFNNDAACTGSDCFIEDEAFYVTCVWEYNMQD